MPAKVKDDLNPIMGGIHHDLSLPTPVIFRRKKGVWLSLHIKLYYYVKF